MANEQNYQNPNPNGFDPNSGVNQNPQNPNNGNQYAYFDPNQQPAQGFNPNPNESGFDPNQFAYDPNQPAPGFDPNQVPPSYPENSFDPNGYANSNSYAQPNAASGFEPNQAGVDPAFAAPQDSNLQPALDQNNTFEEKKTGNKLFLYGAIGLAVVLVGVVGFLLWANFRPGQEPTPAPSQTPPPSQNQPVAPNDPEPLEPETPQAPTVDDSLTGGPDTFATRARVFNAATIPEEWNLRKFFVPSINPDTGACLNIAVCGPESDPDRDGLDNIDEYNFDLDPLSPDTDRDRIADGDELFVYYTDPSVEDSDLDNFTDSQEIAGCYDPTESGTGVRYDEFALATLRQNTSLRGLREPTVSLLRGAGATTADISENGTVSGECEVEPATTSNAPQTFPGSSELIDEEAETAQPEPETPVAPI